jgi:DNA primase
MEKEAKPDLQLVLGYYADLLGRDLDLSRVREYGPSKIKCIFHQDRHPSAVINLETGHFRCFACDAPSGDSYDVIMGQERIDLREAKQWAKDHLGYEGGQVRRTPTDRQYKPSWLTDED